MSNRQIGRIGRFAAAIGVAIAVQAHGVASADNNVPSTNPAATNADNADGPVDPYTGHPSLLAQAMAMASRAAATGSTGAGGGLDGPFLSASPPAPITAGLEVEKRDFHGWVVWSIRPPASTSTTRVVAIHGGGFEKKASVFHWVNYAEIARASEATVIVPIYPLVGHGGTADTVVPRVADLVAGQTAEVGAGNVAVYGDSAGGTIALAATEMLAARHVGVPGRLVLVSPWLDTTVGDPRSARIDDPILQTGTLRKAGKQWAGKRAETDPIVSPLFGSLDGLPPTTVYSGSDDLLSPDVRRLRDRVIAEGHSNVKFVLLAGGLHGWPGFFFLPEAMAVSPAITYELTGVCNTTDIQNALRKWHLNQTVRPGHCEP
ncbi:alpha/beta hydrolase [Nocardia macrotermitis]|uniref:alpha/beta hydrolase n=1 Tax=Nocardia macrotermitis TaxID=2585198 RepID=UPI0012957F60|nr:alpha/beta hydrolase [Nocardia macrotermitis]